VDSAFYPPWNGKMSTSQRAMMLCGWESNRSPGGKQWQPTAWWLTCGLTACTPGTAPCPTIGNEYGKHLSFTNLHKLFGLS